MRVVLAPQRYDRGAKPLVDDLATHRAWARIIGLTEVQERRELLHLDGWGVHAVGDCATTWNTAPVASVRRDRVVWDGSYRTKDGRHITRTASPLVIITDRDGSRTVVITAHAPATVEGEWKSPSARAKAHRQLARALAKAANEAMVEHRCDAAIILADWNLDHRLLWVRAWWALRFPRWTVVAPNLGTHGRRTIDYALVRGLDARMVRRQALTRASDHRAVRFRLARRKDRSSDRGGGHLGVESRGLGLGVPQELLDRT